MIHSFSACVDLYKLKNKKKDEVSSFYSIENIDRLVPKKKFNIFQSVLGNGCTMYDDYEKCTSLL